MHPASQVLLRQQHLFNGSLLLAGAPADQLAAHLPQAQIWSWLADTAHWLQQHFPQRVHCGIRAPGQFAAAVLFLPKSRELTAYLLEQLAARLPADAALYLVGEKRGGIEGASKLLRQLGQSDKLDSARHCQLWRCQIKQPPTARPLEHWQQSYQPEQLKIISLPGVFSHGRLDSGTKLLLEHLDGLAGEHWLDFGCGAGVIGASLKQKYPQALLSLLDVDAFAVHSSQLTLAANQLSARVIHGRGIEDAPKELDAIISNPPFHQGVHTNYLATEQLLRQAVHHLRPGGELRIVANSFLKYPPLIEQYLGPCRILAERDGFRVYSARRAT